MNTQIELSVLHERAEALNALAKKEGRSMTNEEQTEFDNILKKSKEMRYSLKTENELRTDIANAFNTAMDNKNDKVKFNTGMTEYNDGVRAIGKYTKNYIMYTGNNLAEIESRMSEPMHPPKVGCEPLDLFNETSGKFTDANDFWQALNSRQLDPRLEQRTLTVGNAASAGILVPNIVSDKILNVALEAEAIRPRATVWTLDAEKLTIPMWNNFSHTSVRTYNGFLPKWLGEATDDTASTPSLQYMELECKYLTLYCNASIQLANSAAGFDAVLGEAMRGAVSFAMDDAFINGDGVGKPTGLLNDLAKIEVSRATASTISYADCANMFGRVYTANLPNVVWLANPSTIPELLQHTLASGAEAYNVLKEEAGVFRIFGRPVIFSEKLPALGTKGDLILADLSQYQVALNPNFLIGKTDAAEWYSGVVSYRIIMAIDGRGSWVAPITPRFGSTQSWLVILD